MAKAKLLKATAQGTTEATQYYDTKRAEPNAAASKGGRKSAAFVWDVSQDAWQRSERAVAPLRFIKRLTAAPCSADPCARGEPTERCGVHLAKRLR